MNRKNHSGAVTTLAAVLAACVLGLFSTSSIVESSVEAESSTVECLEAVWCQRHDGDRLNVAKPSKLKLESRHRRPVRLTAVPLPAGFYAEHAHRNGTGRPLTL